MYDIIEKVKDTFDVRTMRFNKPYVLLRSKHKKNKLQVFIYHILQTKLPQPFGDPHIEQLM